MKKEVIDVDSYFILPQRDYKINNSEMSNVHMSGETVNKPISWMQPQPNRNAPFSGRLTEMVVRDDDDYDFDGHGSNPRSQGSIDVPKWHNQDSESESDSRSLRSQSDAENNFAQLLDRGNSIVDDEEWDEVKPLEMRLSAIGKQRSSRQRLPSEGEKSPIMDYNRDLREIKDDEKKRVRNEERNARVKL
jgi:hypothetical protein